MNDVAVLEGSKGLIDRGGVVASAYQAGDSFCFLGAIAKTAYGTSDAYSAARGSEAYKYVIEACKGLLPGWDHQLVTNEIYRSNPFWMSKLPEAVLTRACTEGAGKEIALIVFTRAINLAKEAEEIQKAKLADEAEMIAQGDTDTDPVMIAFESEGDIPSFEFEFTHH